MSSTPKRGRSQSASPKKSTTPLGKKPPVESYTKWLKEQPPPKISPKRSQSKTKTTPAKRFTTWTPKVSTRRISGTNTTTTTTKTTSKSTVRKTLPPTRTEPSKKPTTLLNKSSTTPKPKPEAPKVNTHVPKPVGRPRVSSPSKAQTRGKSPKKVNTVSTKKPTTSATIPKKAPLKKSPIKSPGRPKKKPADTSPSKKPSPKKSTPKKTPNKSSSKKTTTPTKPSPVKPTSPKNSPISKPKPSGRSFSPTSNVFETISPEKTTPKSKLRSSTSPSKTPTPGRSKVSKLIQFYSGLASSIQALSPLPRRRNSQTPKK